MNAAVEYLTSFEVWSLLDLIIDENDINCSDGK